jgi:hypothetical protein
MRRFCQWEFDGGRLAPDAAKQEAEMVLQPPVTHSPVRASSIEVVRSFVVKRGNASGPGGEVSFVIDYVTLGRLDDALRFIRSEGRAPNRPVRTREYSDVGRAKATPDNPHPRWKVGLYGLRQRVGLEATIRYVAGLRETASSPELRANADATVNALRRLAAGESDPTLTGVQKSAQGVVREYCTIDGNGGRLTDAGRKTLASLLVQPAASEPAGITVIKDFALSDAAIRSDRTALMMAEYRTIGSLDVRTGRFEPLPVGSLKERTDFTLVLTHAAGTSAWQISSPPPEESFITIDAAKRIVTRLRDTTSDATIRKNAARALSALEHQR